MKIHSSAKFKNSDFSFHNEFELNLSLAQIGQNSTKIVNLALSKFKEKCEEYFKVDFATMCFFEVYFFNGIDEILLFFKDPKTTKAE